MLERIRVILRRRALEQAVKAVQPPAPQERPFTGAQWILMLTSWVIRSSLSSVSSGLGRGRELGRVRGSSRRWWTIRARVASLRHRLALLRVPVPGEGFHV